MDKEGPGLFINSLKVLFCSSWDERQDLFPSSYENIKKQGLTVQPIKLPGKQVKILSDQFPFWICSDIRHWGRVTWPDESSEVQVTRSVASKHEGRSESEHVVEAS